MLTDDNCFYCLSKLSLMSLYKLIECLHCRQPHSLLLLIMVSWTITDITANLINCSAIAPALSCWFKHKLVCTYPC